MHYLKLQLLPTDKNGTCGNFKIKGWTICIHWFDLDGGGVLDRFTCWKVNKSTVKGVIGILPTEMFCRPVNCQHVDLSVHRLVDLSTNITIKKHHLTSYFQKRPKKTPLLTRRLYPTLFQHRNRVSLWMLEYGCEFKVKKKMNKPSQKSGRTKISFSKHFSKLIYKNNFFKHGRINQLRRFD